MILPLALFLGIGGTGALGLHQWFRDWRSLRDRQLLLDRCVFRKAERLESILNRVEKLQLLLKANRIAIAATPEPATRATLIATAEQWHAAIGLSQAQWVAERATWLSPIDCRGLRFSLGSPLPGFPWSPRPPDILGPTLWSFHEATQTSLTIKRHLRPRNAQVFLFKDTSGAFEKWSASWTSQRPSSL